MEGLKAVLARGHKGGRKPKLTEDDKKVARAMLAAGDISVAEIAKRVGVSRVTFYDCFPQARKRQACRKRQANVDPSAAPLALSHRLAANQPARAVRAGKGVLRALRQTRMVRSSVTWETGGGGMPGCRSGVTVAAGKFARKNSFRLKPVTSHQLRTKVVLATAHLDNTLQTMRWAILMLFVSAAMLFMSDLSTCGVGGCHS